MEINYIAPVPGFYYTRIYRYDFGEDWYTSVGFSQRVNAKIMAWLSENVPEQDRSHKNMFGSGNGVCDPEQDYFEFRFTNEKHATLFRAFVQSKEWR